jgi:hypothetical protein
MESASQNLKKLLFAPICRTGIPLGSFLPFITWLKFSDLFLLLQVFSAHPDILSFIFALTQYILKLNIFESLK